MDENSSYKMLQKISTFNLMLAQSANRVITSIDELVKLSTYELLTTKDYIGVIE